MKFIQRKPGKMEVTTAGKETPETTDYTLTRATKWLGWSHMYYLNSSKVHSVNYHLRCSFSNATDFIQNKGVHQSS